MANYRPNTNYNQPIYDLKIRSRSQSTTRATSKMSSPQFRRQQMAQSPGYPEIIPNENNNETLKESQRTSHTDTIIPSPAKLMVPSDSVVLPLQPHRSSQVCELGEKPSLDTNPSVIQGILKTSSNTPKIVPFYQRDFSPSWRKIAMEERKKAVQAAKEKPKESEKPRPLNPLPRVALLCKPNHRRSHSGCGGFYSPSMKPGVQVFDERGRIKPQWDPSPYIPVGKRNAWDDSIPKSDYYRSKYIGWIM
ncbi:unnamed protein product [Allacma fusca]|uniref:Uncharacterized protein n=1 Tax=Allacma fusca TaxID=39272 RepID=A0A8J2JXI6_9HEXA|nr:unnamed protein product [Allacma fusca]